MYTEGDHIKVTASKYPFPTVCADNQSTDWFHSISRTLKWNERERQKSFVVVEEGPAKEKSRSKKHSKLSQSTVASDTPAAKKSPDPVEEEFGEDEEDEVSDEDDEDDKFDIDDSSPEAQPTMAIGNIQTKDEEALGMQKAKELVESRGSHPAANALHDGNAHMHSVKSNSKSRSRSRTRQSGNHSGVDTPGRFADSVPHPPAVSPRHVELSNLTPLSPSTSSDSLAPTHPAQHGARDDINNINSSRGGHSSKSRIPRDRDIDAESMNLKTPTIGETMHSRKGHNRGHAPEEDQHYHRRAFAVWGHDESSDSNASDNDADA